VHKTVGQITQHIGKLATPSTSQRPARAAR
jgi:hypothetical protein